MRPPALVAADEQDERLLLELGHRAPAGLDGRRGQIDPGLLRRGLRVLQRRLDGVGIALGGLLQHRHSALQMRRVPRLEAHLGTGEALLDEGVVALGHHLVEIDELPGIGLIVQQGGEGSGLVQQQRLDVVEALTLVELGAEALVGA